MSASTVHPTEVVQIRSAPELFAALRSPQPAVRSGALQAVTRDPVGALALGPCDGVRLVDALVALVDFEQSYLDWHEVATALTRFKDPAATEFFVRVLESSDDAESAFPAAERLALDDLEPIKERVRAILVDSDHGHRVAAAAQLLIGSTDLTPAELVRIAVADAAAPAPVVDTRTAGTWAAELAGPYADVAQQRIEEQGGPALTALAAIPDRLDWPTCEWLLAAAVGDPTTAVPVATMILSPNPTEPYEHAASTIVAALDLLAALPADDAARDLADPWQQFASIDVRAAAVRAVRRTPSVSEALAAIEEAADDSDRELWTDLVLAMLHTVRGLGEADVMRVHLQDDCRWEVRTAAREQR